MNPARVAATSPSPSFHSVFDLAKPRPPCLDAFDRVFDVYACEASCSVGEALSQKYGMTVRGQGHTQHSLLEACCRCPDR